jgi:hypothetical protein
VKKESHFLSLSHYFPQTADNSNIFFFFFFSSKHACCFWDLIQSWRSTHTLHTPTQNHQTPTIKLPSNQWKFG